ncbi:MAG: sigma-54-dependent Fis family transcriptional regulator [Deltaproteobacteria bacterium]|nr:sigma-54-dependent Fis family transcriptional regulator [Deltaproteobacteria bacterium]
MNKILIVDDEKKMRHILQIILEQKGYRTEQASNGSEALELIKKYHYAMVITDLKMPVMDGQELIREIKKIDPDYPVVVLTAYGSIDSAVGAIREGAIDYITKPFEEEKILLTVQRSIRFSELVDEKRIHREELSEFFEFHNIVTESQQMLQIIKQAAMVSKSPSTTVLLLGESGTGKELLAQAIHYNSSRAAKKFMAINCAAIAPTLIESELFGHEKGAFTGADRQRPGRFEIANEGTVFLDEVGDLTLEAQAKLLRFLQEKEFERVGGTETVQSDVRVIGATNKNLTELVEQQKFREDLFYRLNVFPLYLPPLRDRRQDITALALHFLRRSAKSMGKPNPQINDDAMRALTRHGWPGNIRELQNAIERAVILSADGQIRSEHLGFLSAPGAAPPPAQADPGLFRLPPDGMNLEEFEIKLVRDAIELASENQSEAARLLGLSRGKFRSLVNRLRGDNEEL